MKSSNLKQLKIAKVKQKVRVLAYWAGFISLLVNVLLFIVKYYASYLTDSITLEADAWHTLSDAVSSIIMIVGVRLSQLPADQDHPFGHGRAELISSIIIGVLLAMIAFSFGLESGKKLLAFEQANYNQAAIVITILSVFCKETLAQYTFYIARRTRSSALRADAWHHRSDAISSVVILVGIFIAESYWWVDGVLGIGVSLFIAYTAYQVLSETISALLGLDADHDLEKQLITLCKNVYPNELYIHHIHKHAYGSHNEITFHIRLPPEMTVFQAHQIATLIEIRIREVLNFEATIHIEPIKFD